MNRDNVPIQNEVLIISDYPTETEVSNDVPWSSAGNLENLSYIRQSGVPYNQTHTTYLTYVRPPENSLDSQISKKESLIHKNKIEKEGKFYFLEDSLYENYLALLEELKIVSPKLIICFGKWSAFFLAKEIPYEKTVGTKKDKRPFGAITKYRASFLTVIGSESVIYPIYPSSAMHKDSGKIFQIQADFAKIGELYKKINLSSIQEILKDENDYIFGTSINIIKTFLAPYVERLEKGEIIEASIDIETRGYGIDCIGISFNSVCGLCIPIALVDNPTPWSFEEEVEIFQLLRKFLSYENLHIIGQNFSYDSAYFYKEFALFVTAKKDTMITHHTMYNSVQKSLDFLASIYCEKYKYWKNEREK